MSPGTSGNSCSFTQSFADQRPKFESGMKRRKRKKAPTPKKVSGKIKWY